MQPTGNQLLHTKRTEAPSRRSAVARASRAALLAMSAILAAAGANAAGTWATTLKKRDLNGDGIVDAYYDTTLNITWLYNYSLAGNPSFMTWSQATQWAGALNINGVTGWRLPTFNPNNCDWFNDARGCVLTPAIGTTNELMYMLVVTLGDTKGPFTNNLPMQDINWFNLTVSGQPDRAYGYSYPYAWGINPYLKTTTAWAWPVRPGDVGTPLP